MYMYVCIHAMQWNDAYEEAYCHQKERSRHKYFHGAICQGIKADCKTVL